MEIAKIRKEEVEIKIPAIFFHDIENLATEYMKASEVKLEDIQSPYIAIKDIYFLIIEINANIANRYLKQIELSKTKKMSFDEWLKIEQIREKNDM